jgi:hypothetical protein
MIKKCCVCSKVKMEGKWQKRDESLAGKCISHAYCPSCFAITMARIKRQVPSQNKKMYNQELDNVLYGT